MSCTACPYALLCLQGPLQNAWSTSFVCPTCSLLRPSEGRPINDGLPSDAECQPGVHCHRRRITPHLRSFWLSVFIKLAQDVGWPDAVHASYNVIRDPSDQNEVVILALCDVCLQKVLTLCKEHPVLDEKTLMGAV